ncbi:MAG: 5-formyltetrahydrofolate cyclo-ligase [Paracoccaceae bacterium]
MSIIADRKAAARKAAFARRKDAHDPERGAQATHHLLEHLAPVLGRPISGYMPIRTEINLLPAMTLLAGFGPVGVPVIEGQGKPLAFHLWTPDTKMQDGPFGARVPVLRVPMIPQIIILPLLAYDAAGHRLGYGGGFYDRTLEILRAAGPVHAVGFAYAAQEIDQVPTEPTDQPLDAIITENGMYKV